MTQTPPLGENDCREHLGIRLPGVPAFSIDINTERARPSHTRADIAYLKWVKDKRDYFVHRLFHDGAWPGDLDRNGCQVITRRLLAVQKSLERAHGRVWPLFEAAGFLQPQPMAEGGYLAFNPDPFEELKPD